MRLNDVFELARDDIKNGMSNSGNVTVSNRYRDGKMISAVRSWPDR